VQLIDGVEAARVPLITRDDREAPVGRAIVSIFKPKDSGISALWPTVETSDGINDFMHKEFSGALEAGLIAEPPPLGEIPKEIAAGFSEEARWAAKILDAGRKELLSIGVASNEEGIELRTKNGFRQFIARGRKDIAYSKIYAYVAFLVWLALGSAGGGASEMGDGLVGD
jgi:hypothetical protein